MIALLSARSPAALELRRNRFGYYRSLGYLVQADPGFGAPARLVWLHVPGCLISCVGGGWSSGTYSSPSMYRESWTGLTKCWLDSVCLISPLHVLASICSFTYSKQLLESTLNNLKSYVGHDNTCCLMPSYNLSVQDMNCFNVLFKEFSNISFLRSKKWMQSYPKKVSYVFETTRKSIKAPQLFFSKTLAKTKYILVL